MSQPQPRLLHRKVLAENNLTLETIEDAALKAAISDIEARAAEYVNAEAPDPVALKEIETDSAAICQDILDYDEKSLPEEGAEPETAEPVAEVKGNGGAASETEEETDDDKEPVDDEEEEDDDDSMLARRRNRK